MEWTELRDEQSIRLGWRIANTLRVHEQNESRALLDFRRAYEDQLGLALRWQEAQRRVLALLRGQFACRWTGEGMTLEVEARKGAFRLGVVVERSAYALILPASRPLTPRLVLAALQISSQERVRWTKDGRLLQSGAVMIRRAHPVSVATYAVDTIAGLVEDPSIIAKWRMEDSLPAQATG
ncbi:MAG: hypothetical protein IJ127_27830 [Afipia sp.]|nr:hypothetical protein [Afipia sp.]